MSNIIMQDVPSGGIDYWSEPFILLKTVSIENGVSSLEISLPEGYDEYGLVIDTTCAASCKKMVYHTSVSNARILAESNTAATWATNCKLIQIDNTALGDDDYTGNSTAMFCSSADTSSKIVKIGLPSTILIAISNNTSTFEAGTIKVYGRSLQ